MTSDDSIPKALSGIRDLYTGSLATHGASAKSVGWKDQPTQALRFERLARVINRDRAGGFSVNDWGCGYGAMFGYLDGLAGADLQRYVGYDISEEMLSVATAACDPARARFVLGSAVTEEADYSFVSGTFNVKLQATDAVWETYIKGHLETIYAKSRVGMAFNLLTSHVDWRAENLFYGDPAAFFDFCKRHLSRHVTLVHDYALFEWTLLVSRDPWP